MSRRTCWLLVIGTLLVVAVTLLGLALVAGLRHFEVTQ